MAMESKALADSIVSWASGHLAAVDESYGLVALETHSSAISALSTSIKSDHSDLALHETNAAACLVLMISEVCRGDREFWSRHLQGAKAIIASAQAGQNHSVDAFKTSDEGQWVLRNFAYHDILAAVTEVGSTPHAALLDGNYLEGMTDVIDSCVGVATGVLRIIAEICALERRLSNGELTEGEAQRGFQLLAAKLNTWDCPLETNHDLACVAYAYRSAAQIVLCRTCKSAFTPEYCLTAGYDEHFCFDSIELSVVSLLSAVKAIPVGALVESALLFPLFIAGGEADTDDQQSFIRMRLQSTLHQRQFQNITRALNILEEVWQRKEIDAGADWKDVLRESGGGLILT
jgi:transcriptional activator protein UGA3